MATPNYTQIILISGETARSSDLNAMLAGIASFLGNDVVTTDNINASNAINVMSTDGKNLSTNIPNQGGGGVYELTLGGVVVLKVDSTGFHFSIAGVHIFTVDNNGNAVFKGTVTGSGSPT